MTLIAVMYFIGGLSIALIIIDWLIPEKKKDENVLEFKAKNENFVQNIFRSKKV